MQKKRLQSQNDDKKTERDKLFAEQRTIKDSIKGPSNLQVRGPPLCTPRHASASSVVLLTLPCRWPSFP